MYGYVIVKDGYKRYENPFMCYKSSVSNQTVYNRFRLAAFATPYTKYIQFMFVLCVFRYPSHFAVPIHPASWAGDSRASDASLHSKLKRFAIG